MPQAEARRRRQLGQDIATLPSSAIDTTERVYHMMNILQQDLDVKLQSGKPVRAAVVHGILANAVETAREADPEHIVTHG